MEDIKSDTKIPRIIKIVPSKIKGKPDAIYKEWDDKYTVTFDEGLSYTTIPKYQKGTTLGINFEISDTEDILDPNDKFLEENPRLRKKIIDQHLYYLHALPLPYHHIKKLEESQM